MKYLDMKKTTQILYDDTKPKNSKRFYAVVFIIGIFVLAVLLGVVFLSKDAKALFNPISIVSNISGINLWETDGRTNILILGVDSRSSGSITDNKLTDVMIVVSIGKTDGDIVMISIPRDLWVNNPSGYQSKINAVYSAGYYGELNKSNDADKANTEGIKAVETVAEDVLGMPVHYYATVNFEIFKATVDTIGGISVNVDNTFTDYQYPIEGKENAPENERYQTVHFDAGTQTMDGETALKFVRSRHSIDLEEGTDFARSKRQQKVITAIKDKVLSVETLLSPGKISGLYANYAKNVKSDVDLQTAQAFAALAQKSDFSKVKSVVLDNENDAESGGLLYAPDMTLYNGQYVLIPRAGDFSQIHAFVQRYLFGNK